MRVRDILLTVELCDGSGDGQTHRLPDFGTLDRRWLMIAACPETAVEWYVDTGFISARGFRLYRVV